MFFPKIKINGDVETSYYCNWSNLNIKIDLKKFNGNIIINFDSISDNIEEELIKVKEILSIEKLNKITFTSEKYEYAKIISKLFEKVNVRKRFELINDFQIRNRNEIDFSVLTFDEVVIPYDYYMYMENKRGITEYGYRYVNNNGVVTYDSSRDSVLSLIGIDYKIEQVLDEIFSGIDINELTDVDKSILISNWLQKNVQFFEGKESKVGDRLFICDDYNERYDLENPSTLLDKHVGVCAAFSKVSLLLLMHPKVGCKCNLVPVSGHLFFIQDIDNHKYAIDNTWCVTRNKNHYVDELGNESLKAMEFNDEYLLFGQEKIEESEDIKKYHTTNSYLGNFNISLSDFPRDIIKKSVEKLTQLGVEFYYDVNPVYMQYCSKNDFKKL